MQTAIQTTGTFKLNRQIRIELETMMYSGAVSVYSVLDRLKDSKTIESERGRTQSSRKR